MNDTLKHADLVALLGTDYPVILEVGCNDGVDTLAMAKVFPEGRIYCFEPIESARVRWRHNLDEQRRGHVFAPRITLHPIAIGAMNGLVDFYPSHGDGVLQPTSWDYSGSIHQPKNHLKHHPWCGFGTAIKVPLMRLDSWSGMMGVSHVDFIWADVQGAEGDLIRGGMNTLARTRYLYTEFSDAELYESQVNLKTLLAMLPGEWEIVRRYTEDVLLKNTAL